MKIQNQNIFCTNLHVAMGLVSMNRFHGCNPIFWGNKAKVKTLNVRVEPITQYLSIQNLIQPFLHSYCCLQKGSSPTYNTRPMTTDIKTPIQIPSQWERMWFIVRREGDAQSAASRRYPEPEPVQSQSAETLLRVESPPGAPTQFTYDPKQTEQDVLQTDRVLGLGALLHRRHGQPDQDDWQCPLRHGREGDLPGPRVHPDPKGEDHRGGPREPEDARAATG